MKSKFLVKDKKTKKISIYKRDVYLAKLIDGSRRTDVDGFPIIEKWMVADQLPKEIVQWNQKYNCNNIKETALSFYAEDSAFNSVISYPEKYLEIFEKYACVIGLDASPYDNMPLVVQKNQIFLNLAFTYFLGRKGIKIIPNVRLGDINTLSSLAAYPKKTLIAIGTNGFVKALYNRNVFTYELNKIVEILEPSGILVYGPTPDWLFKGIRNKGIDIYQYDSYITKRRRK